MRLLPALLVALLSAAPMASQAATATMPESGTRIRLTAMVPDKQRWVGPFVSLAHDTVSMREGDMNGALRVVYGGDITRFEVSRGKHRNGGRGAGLGLLGGALLGALVGEGAAVDGSVDDDAATLGIGAVAGGLYGAMIGTVVGIFTTSEKWRDLPLESLRGAAVP